MMTKPQRWWQFTIERFEPASHITMIVVFLIAHVLVARALMPLSLKFMDYIILFIGVTAFYFKLRLYDEVKDYELDVVINKTRPLPRGLLALKDMFRGMAVCILIELVCFVTNGPQGLFSMIIAIIYSLIMYKEFFIPEKIRPLLTTYALVHTIVTTLLSFAIFSFITKHNFYQVVTNINFLSFALANWLLFNIFEFGRKTFATSEERPNVDTYSSLFGRTGAVILVASQAIIAFALSLNLINANHTVLIWGNAILLVILAILSTSYIIKDKATVAKFYRNFSSVYIIVYFLILIAAHLITR
jgi:4-hydroxybenzoate polyprenyltransferase